MLSGCKSDKVTKEKDITPIPTTGVITPTETVKESQENKEQLLPGFVGWEENEAIKELNQVLTMEATVKVVNAEYGRTGTTTLADNYLNAINQLIIYDFEESLILDNYAVVDMDRDNTPEVIVNLSSGMDGWIIVLRYYEGSVYGYPFVYRGLLSPKMDGTYMASSGAADNNIIEMSFNGYELQEKILGCSISMNDVVEYYVTGQKVSEKDYNNFSAKFFDKEDVSWHPFSSMSERIR
jgi:hypothetical protein